MSSTKDSSALGFSKQQQFRLMSMLRLGLQTVGKHERQHPANDGTVAVRRHGTAPYKQWLARHPFLYQGDRAVYEKEKCAPTPHSNSISFATQSEPWVRLVVVIVFRDRFVPHSNITFNGGLLEFPFRANADLGRNLVDRRRGRGRRRHCQHVFILLFARSVVGRRQ